MIDCFGLYLMSACSVHIHIHRNKAVLLLFCLCFLVSLSLSLSFHFHLCCITCCATSIPRNNSAYPFHAFPFSSLLLSVLLSTLMNYEYGRWSKVVLYVILGYLLSWTCASSLSFFRLKVAFFLVFVFLSVVVWWRY